MSILFLPIEYFLFEYKGEQGPFSITIVIIFYIVMKEASFDKDLKDGSNIYSDDYL